MDDQNRDPETPAFSGQTWDDRRKRDPESWKALSETAAESPIVELSEPILIPPAQREHTGTPVSFLRWCGHQTIHSPHGRCGGVK